MAKADKTSRSKGGKTNRSDPYQPLSPYLSILWVAGLGVLALIVASLVSYHPADFPGHSVWPHHHVGNDLNRYAYHNFAGRFGAIIAHKAYLLLGPGVWVAVLALAAVLGWTAAGKRVNQPILRTIGVAILTLCTSAIVGVTLPLVWSNFNGRPEGTGGLLAIAINGELLPRFAAPGTLVILAVAWWIGLVLAAEHLALAAPRILGETLLRLCNVRGRLADRLPAWLREGTYLRWLTAWLPNPAQWGWVQRLNARLHKGPRQRLDDLDDFADPDAEDTAPRKIEVRSSRRKESKSGAPAPGVSELADMPEDPKVSVHAAPPPPVSAVQDGEDDADADATAADAPAAYIAEKREFSPEELRQKMAQLPINFAPKGSSKADEPPREMDLSGYQFPGMDVLEEPEGNFTEAMAEIVRAQAAELEAALQQYNIEGEVVGIDSGPVITMFEVRLAPGTKSAKLQAVNEDIARALKTQNIRIVPVLAGKDTVGVEVPNIKKERVRLKELMTVGTDILAKMKLPMFLGKDASGTPLIADLNAMPHMLIAGTTGSGKSVCMNSIIMSFLFTKRPDELKLVLVDPKMVEMSMFKAIPHLMCPVVTEMAKAASILEWAVTKMDERYELLAEAGVRDIAGYNNLEWEELKERMGVETDDEAARIPRKLPYLVFIIDELADLMMTNKEVEGHIVRIAQKARAVGMHLILATQRPQANVVTGLIKSNMPCRIAMKVASGMDSRIVLDQKGGELLLGHGDMLFLSPRSSELTRAQGTLVDDSEIRKTVKFLKDVSAPSFEPQLVQIKGSGEIELDDERDELFDEAVRMVIETNRGSVSLLQRRLNVGYSRASRIIEQIARAGILGDYKGTQAREVTITIEEWDAMQAQAARDAGESDGLPTSVGMSSDNDGEDDEEDLVGAVPAEFDDEYRN